MKINNAIYMINFVCHVLVVLFRPSQHGADLLSLLSKLLDENTRPGETENTPSALVVSLALQALEQLCKAEVSHTTGCERSFAYRAVSLWNMLDEDLRNVTSVKAFKKVLKLAMNE